MKKFSKKEIAALEAAGIVFEVDGNEIVVACGYDGGRPPEAATSGDIDSEKTDEMVRKVCEMFADQNVGGFCAGWGGWHLRKGYSSPTADYDWCDVSSPHHY